MKRVFLFLFVSAISLSVYSQTGIESDSYGLDSYIEKCSDIPVLRKINGGTVFKITYEPESAWDNSMKGAFEYACKIWEEQLPNTLPINIHAKIGNIRGSGNGKLLSRVLPTSYRYGTYNEELTSRIKYVLLAEYNSGSNVTFSDSIDSEDFFNKPDITITYNQNMLDEFSYSLYSTPVDKYDFVTIVLRDIAKGLGFISGFTADSSLKAFQNYNRPSTFYEGIILEAIGASDIHTAYENSTKGSLPLSVPYYGNLNLYAPKVWKNGVSLNYFIPDSTKNISEILNYNLGRGSVIRNITDNYKILFEYLQGWQTYNRTTGFNGKSVSSEGSSNNRFNYNGSLTISYPNQTSAVDESRIYSNEDRYTTSNTSSRKEGFNLGSYLFPYDYKYPDAEGRGSWLVSLLKKDGTWDLVYRQGTGSFDIPLDVSMSDLNINSDYDQYQRTCDGYIRCRITHYKEVFDYLYQRIKYDIKNYYYVLDYLPQKVKMGFEFSSIANTISYNSSDDDYTQEIRIDINGLEGVDRIVVEQLDEGNEFPVAFEVKDFKKGYFTALVDKELYTQFTVYSYNKNGYTKSDDLTIAPLSPYQQAFLIRKMGENNINIAPHRKDLFKPSTFKIYSNMPNRVTPMREGIVKSTNYNIDISGLKSGNYILSIQSGKKMQNYKFAK